VPTLGRKETSFFLLINPPKKVKIFELFSLFFLPHELHGLAAAVQRSLSGNDHFHLVTANFTDVDLPDFVRHLIHLPE
jgi:hypothetical protein